MNKLTLNKTIITGILIFLCVHEGSLLVTSILENFTNIIFEIIGFPSSYGYLPWTKFIVLPLELYLMLKYLKKIDDNQYIFDHKKIFKLTILTLVLLIGIQFRHELEPSIIVCGNVIFNEEESKQYFLNMEIHSQQEFITDAIVKIMYGFFILFVVLMNYKNSLNKNKSSHKN